MGKRIGQMGYYIYIYISEFDGSFRELQKDEHILHEIDSKHLFAIYYAGPSSVAQAVAVHKDHTMRVKSLQWHGRSMCLDLRPPVNTEIKLVIFYRRGL